jgi:exodeoxyribonuclease-3
MKIATFNANSLRVRLPIVLDWLAREKPDVLALQETKVRDEEFPRDALEKAGWCPTIRGQKSYNGVAFLSRKPPAEVRDRLNPGDTEEEARFLAAEWEGVLLVNTYVPQGYAPDSPKFQKKLTFFKDLKKYFDHAVPPDRPALWMGDLNVAPTEIDLWDPTGNAEHVCCHPQAREAYARARGETWTDLFREKEKGPGHYTYWDYLWPQNFAKNKGWRIDHILGTPPMVKRLKEIRIDRNPRGLDKPSDHTFLVAEFVRNGKH